MAQAKSANRKKSKQPIESATLGGAAIASAPLIDLEETGIASEDSELSPLGDAESDLLGEEAVLDDEELNPFGDKWEQ